MTLKKSLIAFIAATALATPAIARTQASHHDMGYTSGNGIIAILIGLLVPAVQKVREI